VADDRDRRTARRGELEEDAAIKTARWPLTDDAIVAQAADESVGRVAAARPVDVDKRSDPYRLQ
jgi:hypothetical protein